MSKLGMSSTVVSRTCSAATLLIAGVGSNLSIAGLAFVAAGVR